MAALYAKEQFGIRMVLILDWDVHFGNGTHDIFAESDDVMVMSAHRYDEGRFFPYLESGNLDFSGKGDGLGYNINIPWNTG